MSESLKKILAKDIPQHVYSVINSDLHGLVYLSQSACIDFLSTTSIFFIITSNVFNQTTITLSTIIFSIPKYRLILSTFTDDPSRSSRGK